MRSKVNIWAKRHKGWSVQSYWVKLTILKIFTSTKGLNGESEGRRRDVLSTYEGNPFECNIRITYYARTWTNTRYIIPNLNTPNCNIVLSYLTHKMTLKINICETIDRNWITNYKKINMNMIRRDQIFESCNKGVSIMSECTRRSQDQYQYLYRMRTRRLQVYWHKDNNVGEARQPAPITKGCTRFIYKYSAIDCSFGKWRL